MRDNSDTILAALRDHASLTAAAVLIAALIALPLAVLGVLVPPARRPDSRIHRRALHDPVAGAVRLARPVPGLGAITVLIGLVLYALLVIVRNALAGLRQVPPEVREAAEGMGYGRLGRLLRIELPLALPGILTGLRLATVSTVALVTVGVRGRPRRARAADPRRLPEQLLQGRRS